MTDGGAGLPLLLGQRVRRASPDGRAHRDREHRRGLRAAGHPNRAFVFGSTSKVTLAGAGVGAVRRLDRQRQVVPEAHGQAHHRRRQDQPAASRAAAAEHRRASTALMDRHRAIVAPKFAAGAGRLRGASRRHRRGAWTRPEGRLLHQLDVLDGCAKQVVKLAKEAGVELTPAGATHPLRQGSARPHHPHRADLPRPAEVAQAAEGVVAVGAAGRSRLGHVQPRSTQRSPRSPIGVSAVFANSGG